MSWLFGAAITPAALSLRLRPAFDRPAGFAPQTGRATGGAATEFTRRIPFAEILSPGYSIADVAPESVVDELCRVARDLFSASRIAARQVTRGTIVFAGACDREHGSTLHTTWGSPAWAPESLSVPPSAELRLVDKLSEALELPCTLISTAEAAAWDLERLFPVSRHKGGVADESHKAPILFVDAGETIVGWWTTSPKTSGGRDLPLGALRPGTLPLAWPGWGLTVDGLASSQGVLHRWNRILDEEAANETHLAERFRRREVADSESTTGDARTSDARVRMAPHGRLRSQVQSFNDLIQLADRGDRLSRSLLMDAATVLGWGVAQAVALVPTEKIVFSGEVLRGDESLVFEPLRQILWTELRGSRIPVPQLVVSPYPPGGILDAALRRAEFLATVAE